MPKLCDSPSKYYTPNTVIMWLKHFHVYIYIYKIILIYIDIIIMNTHPTKFIMQQVNQIQLDAAKRTTPTVFLGRDPLVQGVFDTADGSLKARCGVGRNRGF